MYIEPEDIDLIMIELPKNPCSICNYYPERCGCSKEMKYREKIKILEDANVLELTIKYNKIKEINREIIELKKQKKILIDDFKQYNVNIYDDENATISLMEGV